MEKQIEQKVYEGFGHIARGFQVIADAFHKAGLEELGETPSPTIQNPIVSASATTAKAKKAADKKAAEKIEEPAQTESAPVEEQKAAIVKKETKAKKADEPEFETLDRDGKIEHLRGRMVQVSVKLNGDRDKVYSFLKKYKASKVHELSDDNLDNLKNDIEVFLGGPDALDI